MLATYTAKARDMSTGALAYALADVRATLEFYKDNDPAVGYPAKLWAEFDAYIVELQKRRKSA